MGRPIETAHPRIVFASGLIEFFLTRLLGIGSIPVSSLSITSLLFFINVTCINSSKFRPHNPREAGFSPGLSVIIVYYVPYILPGFPGKGIVIQLVVYKTNTNIWFVLG